MEVFQGANEIVILPAEPRLALQADYLCGLHCYSHRRVWVFTLVLIYNEYRRSCNINKPRSLRPWVYLRIQIMRTMEVSGTVWDAAVLALAFDFCRCRSSCRKFGLRSDSGLVLATSSTCLCLMQRVDGWSHIYWSCSPNLFDAKGQPLNKWQYVKTKAWL